jgi:alpha-1,2-mannosyltransferase
VLHGRSPYPPAEASVLAHERSFVYPAPAALLAAPLAVLPLKVSATILAVALVAAFVAALRIVGVRDWRCYGVALLCQPMANTLTLDAVSPLLALGVAIAWRYRDRTWPAALALTAVVVLKLFLWPLILWFAFTRRLRTALVGTGLAVGVTLLSWAVIGFEGLRSYPELLRILTRLVEGKGYSLVSLGLALHAGSATSRAVAVLIGCSALALIAVRGRRPGADSWSFIVAIAATLALSPIVWPHYFLLVFVAIGIAAPRLTWLWALPLLLWVVGAQSTYPPIWHSSSQEIDPALSVRVGHLPLIAYAIAIVGATLAIAAYRSAGRGGET